MTYLNSWIAQALINHVRKPSKWFEIMVMTIESMFGEDIMTFWWLESSLLPCKQIDIKICINSFSQNCHSNTATIGLNIFFNFWLFLFIITFYHVPVFLKWVRFNYRWWANWSVTLYRLKKWCWMSFECFYLKNILSNIVYVKFCIKFLSCLIKRI